MRCNWLRFRFGQWEDIKEFKVQFPEAVVLFFSNGEAVAFVIVQSFQRTSPFGCERIRITSSAGRSSTKWGSPTFPTTGRHQPMGHTAPTTPAVDRRTTSPSAGLWAGRPPTPSGFDVHGAGAQRSDPKTGPLFPYATTHMVTTNSVTYTGYSFGPQGDAIRGLNYVRLVRGGIHTASVVDWRAYE